MRILLCMLLLVVSGCAIQAPELAVAEPLRLGALPPVSMLDSLRHTSLDQFNGAFGTVIATSPDAVRYQEAGYPNYYYRLYGNDEALSFVIASWGPDWDTETPDFSGCVINTSQDEHPVGGWYGVADFASGVWRWEAAVTSDGLNVEPREFADVIDPLSEGGMVYFAVVTYGVGNDSTAEERPLLQPKGGG